MRRIAIASALLAVFVCAALAGEGAYFEYEVVVEGAGLPPELAQQMGTKTMRTWFQDDMFKMDFGDGLQSVIVRKDKGVVWIVHGPQKVYSEFPFELFNQMMEQSKRQADQMDENAEFKKTGRTKKIGRWNCYEVIATFRDPQGKQPVQKSYIWLTKAKELDPKKLAETFKWDMFGQSDINERVLKYPELDGFPVQVISEGETPQGKLKSTMTLKNFQRKTFPKSIFEPPAGYRKMEIRTPQGGQMPMPVPPQGQ
ncbi:MAG TPA: DUF4412 domain-containing protein [Proteobacteria bacterium]|nr:DUF4412 domain-containing protein [Pseudomonadota bacterium]